MTADPRATARQWLAGRHAEAFNKCWHSYSCGEPCSDCLVEAILTAGVTVTILASPHSDTQRVALLLPTEEGAGT